MTPPFIHLDLTTALPEPPADSILSRTIHQDEAAKVVLFRFAPGQELSEHTAAVPATVHILDGTGELVLGPERFTAQPGTWAHMPPRLPHSVRADTPLTMLLIMFHGASA
jgi:quercetin dioxygenase-like cupin family protein